MVAKNWQDQHFGATTPAKPLPRRRWPWVIGIIAALFLVSGAGIGTAHYLGVINARDWYDRSLAWISSATDEATAAADAYFNNEPAPSTPIEAADVQQLDPSVDRQLAEDQNEQTTSIATSQKKPLSESARKELQKAVTMLTKDLKGVEREIAQLREQLVIHHPYWQPPTAAEREVLGLNYLKNNGKLNSVMYTRVTDVIRNARIDMTNHRTRIDHLNGVRESLISRAQKAQNKLGTPITP
jgi:hypothetical protein